MDDLMERRRCLVTADYCGIRETSNEIILGSLKLYNLRRTYIYVGLTVQQFHLSRRERSPWLLAPCSECINHGSVLAIIQRSPVLLLQAK